MLELNPHNHKIALYRVYTPGMDSISILPNSAERDHQIPPFRTRGCLNTSQNHNRTKGIPCYDILPFSVEYKTHNKLYNNNTKPSFKGWKGKLLLAHYQIHSWKTLPYQSQRHCSIWWEPFAIGCYHQHQNKREIQLGLLFILVWGKHCIKPRKRTKAIPIRGISLFLLE